MPTKKPKTEDLADVRVLSVYTVEGELEVTLPVDAKLTFGPTIPYAKKDRSGYSVPTPDYSLRIYKGSAKDNLIAVFAGVYSFRDRTIPVRKLVVREAGKSIWKSDEDGWSAETEVKKDKKYVQLTGFSE